MKRISIRERLILVYLVISAMAILGVGGLSYFVSRQALTQRTFAQLTSLKTVKKRQIEQFFHDRNRDINLLAASEEATKLIEYLQYMHEGESPAIENDNLSGLFSRSSYINRYFHNSWYYNQLIACDTTGFYLQLQARPGDTTAKISYGNIMQSSMSGLFTSMKKNKPSPIILEYKPKDSLDEPAFLIASTIIHDKKILGFVAFKINLRTIDAIMLEKDPSIGLGNTGESYLVGDDYFLRSSSRFQDHHILKTQVKTEGVKRAFTLGEGTDIYQDYRGIFVLGSFGRANIPGFNWVILAEIDLPEAFAPIYDLRSKILFFSILMAATVFILTVVIAGRITRPLGRLQHAARSLGEGTFEFVTAPETHDEIQELTETFNQMTDKLRVQQDELKEERIKRSLAMIDGQELERQRLSRELHDGLGQSLVALKMRLESAIGGSPEQSQIKLKEATRDVNSTISEVRRMSNNLMPAVLKEFGLPTAIQNLCNENSENSQVTFSFSYDHIHTILGGKLQTYLFRIVQEALTNIIKHADAQNATVFLSTHDQSIKLKIEDNGVGINKDRFTKASGSGLIHMRERVNLLKGVMEISSIPGKGTIIAIEIPLNPDHDE